MRIQTPDYFDSFSCWAGACPDTCCAGWEITIDEETFYRYQVAPGAFGEHLRTLLQEDGEDKSFILTGEGRCPCLKEDNLCSLYQNLGEDWLCQTCAEHPRSFVEIGEWEQIDLSLSCPAVAELFFKDPKPFSVSVKETEEEGDPISEEDTEMLKTVLELQKKQMEYYLHGPADEVLYLTPANTDALWAEQFASLEYLGTEWQPLAKQVRRDVSLLESTWNAMMTDSLGKWIRKLGEYFSFRYCPDLFWDGEETYETDLISKCLWYLRLLSAEVYLSQGKKFSEEDLRELVRMFSKQIEFSEYNLEILKGLQ